MKYMLDVNALIAILWASHENHAAANAWMAGIATFDTGIDHPAVEGI
jgi:predicted nucleic acid-binding protein